MSKYVDELKLDYVQNYIEATLATYNISKKQLEKCLLKEREKVDSMAEAIPVVNIMLKFCMI
jgi:hypothetical protein